MNETINLLNIKPNGIYVDATLGYGGHTLKVLEQLNQYGKMICFDKDITALSQTKIKLKNYEDKIKLINDDFKNIKNYINYKIDGIIFDLGISTPQIKTYERGFSYKNNCPLDMRMDLKNILTAKYIVNNYSIEKLKKIFIEYGEERFSAKIANKIIIERNKYKIEYTDQLVKIIKSIVPYEVKKKKHPAKKIFQALRMEVNNEIDSIKEGIKYSIELLKQNAIICVITFHSIEDRIVKNIFLENSSSCICSKEFPICICKHLPTIKIINKKPIIPSINEINNNPKSRSAKLRACIKL